MTVGLVATYLFVSTLFAQACFRWSENTTATARRFGIKPWVLCATMTYAWPIVLCVALFKLGLRGRRG